MNTTRIRGNVRTLIHVAVFILFALSLWWKLQLGLVRYFDADEFAYLHWAHNVYTGRIPIIDFLMYAPPGFLYILAPIYAFFTGTGPLIIGRVFAWLVYVGIVIILGLIHTAVRRGKRMQLSLLLLPGFMLSVLAIPADKMLEIRPDNIATFLALLGVYSEVLLFSQPRPLYAFSTGLFYTASLFVLPKTLPFILVGLCTALGRFLTSPEQGKRQLFIRWIMGCLIPCAGFLLWVAAVTPGGEGVMRIIYSLTRLPFEVNRIAERFGMQADLFFYPNWTYYGLEGWNIVLIVNHVLWLFGIFVSSIRLMTPFLPNGKDGVWQELLLAGTYFANVIMFMYGYPLRHAQYLIPVAVFIAFYAADGIYTLMESMARRSIFVIAAPIGLGSLVFLGIVLSISSKSKLAMTNADDLAFLSAVTRTIPRDAYVLDLVGTTIYYRDPYYVSAVPFGEWKQYLSEPLPDLLPALTATNTRYIYAGKLGRVSSLSHEEQTHIAERYSPMPEPLMDLLVKDK